MATSRTFHGHLQWVLSTTIICIKRGAVGSIKEKTCTSFGLKLFSYTRWRGRSLHELLHYVLDAGSAKTAFISQASIVPLLLFPVPNRGEILQWRRGQREYKITSSASNIQCVFMLRADFC